ncbi:methyltransferase domain-containing protein [bacterium]|nr:methyltransferase domain-containing protein [bacterium]
MKQAARYQALAELFDAVLSGQGVADRILGAYLRERGYIGSGDRRFITERFWQSLRQWQSLIWQAQQLGMPLTGRSLMLLNADISGFDGSAYSPEPLTETETSALAARPSLPLPPAHIAANLLEWNHQLLAAQYGDELPALLAAMDEEAPTTLRTNRLKTTREKLLDALSKAGIAARPGLYSPDGVILEKRMNISALKPFQDGWCEVQDEASQLIAMAADAKPGMKVIDLCAGAGGKTLAIAAAMQNKGEIIACDIDRTRLNELEKRARRAGVAIIRPHLLDETRPISGQLPEQSADLVLVDAPCSGSGTWRRAPDSRWRYEEQGLMHFTGLQTRLVSDAAPLVKPGGRLIYATCSIYRQENHDVVDEIAKNIQYLVGETLPETIAAVDKKNPKSISSRLQLTPHLHKTDGMFMASFRRT